MKNILFYALFSLFASLIPTVGMAQNIDWLVNMNDTGSDPTEAGGFVTHNISIVNAGFDSAPASTFTFTIDTGNLFAVNGFSGCSPALPLTGPATITCDINPLIPDGVQAGTIDVQVFGQGTVNGTIDLATAGDVDTDNNQASNTTTIIAGANLEQTIVGSATAASGDIVTFTTTTENLGPNPSTDATVFFPVPVGFNVTNAPAACTSNDAGDLYECPIPATLNPTDTFDFNFEGQIVSGSNSTVTFLTNVEGVAPGDPIPANNTNSFDVTITAGSDVFIGKSRTPVAGILVGDPVTFTLESGYNGDIPNSLTVTDTIPDEYTINSVVDNGWSCSVALQTVTCTLASGTVAGDNISLPDIQINTTANQVAEDIINTASIASAGPFDPVTTNNTAQDFPADIIEPTVDLRISKSGPPSDLSTVGSTYTYTLNSTNLGTADFFGTVTIEDLLPTGMTIQTVDVGSSGWNCGAPPLVGPATYTCTLEYTSAIPLLSGETTPDIILGIETTQTGEIINNARVSSVGNLPDNQLGNNQTGTSTTGETSVLSADIAVLKIPTPTVVPAGDILTFDFEITNTGPTAATDIVFEDAFTQLQNSLTGPTDSGFISFSFQNNSATGMSCATTPTSQITVQLDCTIDTLPICTPGVDCPTITAQVRPGGEASPRMNTASAYSLDVSDPDLDNNEVEAPYTVEARADIVVSKLGAPDPATAGQDITYVITALNANNGLSTSDDVQIVDTLPAGVFFVSANADNGTCTTSLSPGDLTTGTETVTCDFGDIPNGSQETAVIVVRPSTAVRSTTIVNSVSASTTTVETDLTNNTDDASFFVNNPSVNLVTNKIESLDPVAIGDQTVYTVTILNAGPSVAENVDLIETLPPTGLSYLSYTASGAGTCTEPAVGSIGGSMVCSWPTLGVNESVFVDITMEGDTKGVAENNITAESDESRNGFESSPADNDASENTTVRTRADMEVVSKIATPNPANLRDNFVYTAIIRNTPAPNTAEADGVVVTDVLPANMELTGTPSATVVGSTTLNTCTGVAGSTQFQCAFGTVTQNTEITLTIPVKVTSVSTQAEVFTNTISVTTSSLDINGTNNSNSGDVTINSSSFDGIVFYDFDEDGTLDTAYDNNGDSIVDGSDIGIGGETITLTGVALDGTAISLTTTTNPDGTYSFEYLPEGTYTLTQTDSGLPNTTPGQALAGSEGGTPSNPDAVTTISLPGNAEATEYNFTEISNSGVGASKAATGAVVDNNDATFTQRFQITIENLSLEPLFNITLDDTLAGAYNSFGSYNPLGTLTGGTLNPGEYTVVLENSTCTRLVGGTFTPAYTNTGFNGATDTILGDDLYLNDGDSCAYTFFVRWAPDLPAPVPFNTAIWENQATVTGDGLLSGQTSGTNPQLSDLSNNGTNPDPNGNNRANEAGENDPTPINPPLAPGVALVKDYDLSALSSPVMPGDIVTYSFDVINTGNMRLTNVVVTDPLLGGVIQTIPQLDVGETVTFTQPYALTAADVSNNGVTNTATVEGTHSLNGGTPVTTSDISGTAQNNDTPTTYTFGQIALVKTADTSAFQSPPQPGDILTYTFAIHNLGEAELTNVFVTDLLPGLTITGNPIASIPPGSVNTSITGTYPITQADIDAGDIVNTADVEGTWGDGGTTITATDTSGSATNNDDPTVTPVAQVNDVSVVKIETANTISDPTNISETISYAFEIRNNGNTTLTNISLTELLPGATVIGTPIPTLLPGNTDTTTYTASYAVTQADIDAGDVRNSARVDGTAPGAIPVSDISGSTHTTDDDIVTPLFQFPEINLIKIADDSALQAIPRPNDVVAYTFEIRNTGNVTLTNINVTDLLPGIVITGGPIPTLAPGDLDNTTISATYPITQANIDAGFVENTATAQGLDPNNAPTTDISGTAIGNDTPTNLPITQVPDIALVKTSDISAFQSPPQAGDTLTYEFAVTNTGNVTLTNVDVTDLLPDLTVNGTIVSLAPLATDATTITGTYSLKQSDINAGLITNTATVEGIDPNTNPVTDISGTTNANDTPNDTTIQQSPEISLVKIADTSALSTPTQIGDEISWDFTLENTGNVTLTNISVTDLLPGITVSGAPIATMEPGDINTTTYTATYSITQTDIDRGFLENTATAEATDPNTNPVTDTSGTNTTNDTPTVAIIPQNPVLSLVKTADISAFQSPPQVGDAITYAFAIRNEGNVTLTNVGVTDLLPGIVISGGPIPTMAPGDLDDTTISASYAITQADIDAGFVENTATVEGLDPNNAPVTDISGTGTTNDTPTNAPVAQTSGITLVKTADTSALQSPPQALDQITYEFSITNTGNVTLTNVDVTDLLPGITIQGSPIASLAPGVTDNTSITATYPITQANIDAGFIENTATVTGLDPNNAPVTDTSGTATTNDTPTNTPLVRSPDIALVKTSDTAAFQSPPQLGDEIAYTFAITNTGNVTLTNIDVTDLLPGIVLTGGPILTLAPGELDDTTISATYALTQTDIDAGFVENTATAEGLDPENTPVSDVSGTTLGNDTPTNTPVTQDPQIALIKTADVSATSDPAQVGETITYAFSITNTGNVTLTNVNVTDLLPGLVLNGTAIPSMAPGDVDTSTFSATYDITQADIDNGFVENTATVTGLDPNNAPTTDISGTTNGDDIPTQALLSQDVAITLIKTADTSALQSPPQVNDIITYAFEIENTGNVTLTNVDVTDLLPGIVVTGGPIASMDPDEVNTSSITATYAITQADIDAGFVENTATVEGTDPDNNPVTDISGTDATNDTPTNAPIPQDPRITLVKTADTTGLQSPPQVGDEISYTFAITNAGNVTLTNVDVTDLLPGIIVTGGPIPSMAPGAVNDTTISATYALTQSDINAGFVENTATVEGLDPTNAPVTDISGTDASNDTPTNTPVAQNASIALVKTADTSAFQAPPQVGDVIAYTFTITNTGNVTLTNVNVTDLLPGITLTGGPIPSMAPSAVDSTTISATYALTQADIDAGFVENTATTEGRDPNNAPVTDISGTTNGDDIPTNTPITQDPQIALVKTADTTAFQSPPQVGDEIAYTFAITNTGNVTITNINITDLLPGIVITGGPIPTLAPNDLDDTTISATYALTQVDIDAGFVENTATAEGLDPNNAPVTDISGTTNGDDVPTNTPVTQSPAISLVKTADTAAFQSPPQVGDEIAYTFTILNEGNTTLTNVNVTDLLPGITITGGPIASMAPGDLNDTTISATYALTQADIDAGFVENTATVEGLDPNNTPVTDISGTTTGDDIPTNTPVAQDPQIALIKTADTSAFQSPPQVGDEIAYTFAITNTGNVTLTSVEVTDLLPGITITGGPIDSMLPGDIDDTTISATYALTQADIDAGFVENTATTEGRDPNNAPVTDISGTTNGDDIPTNTPIAQTSSIAVVKIADESNITNPALPNQDILYSFQIRNTGNTTLTAITLAENLPGAIVSGGPIPSLAPGAEDTTTFTATYATTQADINNGEVANTATVTGTTPTSTTVEDISGETYTDDLPIVTTLTQAGDIALVKTADTMALQNPPQVGDEITYRFAITNTGNVTLTNVTVSDLLPGIMISGGPIPSMNPGALDDTSISATYAITQADIDAGFVENTATVEGLDPNNAPVTDTSGTDTTNDIPTTAPIAQVGTIALIKRAFVDQPGGISVVGDEIRYTFEITNTGNTTLTDVYVEDTLPGLVMSGTPISSLAPGATDTTTYTAIYAVTAQDFVNAEVVNQATAFGNYDDGLNNTVVVSATSGTETGNTDPTVVVVSLPEIDLDINIADIIDNNNDGLTNLGDEIVFEFIATNLGNVPLDNVNIDVSSLSLDFQNISCQSTTLAVGESATLVCTGNAWEITPADVANGTVSLSGEDTGTSAAGIEVRSFDVSEAAVVSSTIGTTITATKISNTDTILVGQTVEYTLEFTFSEPGGLPTPVRIVDRLPDGFAYVNDSATLNGVATDIDVQGNTIVFPERTLADGTTLVATLEAVALGQIEPGDHTNETWVINTSGLRISNVATATVSLGVEPVFHCSTIIGRVFIDRNHNGYFDGHVNEPRDGSITDQTYYGDKWGAHSTSPTHEQGLGGIRLVAPNGLAVYTDEHGRYSIPCGALPSNIGSNYQLKLDERTLPTGYVVTTENPRVVRLTAGMTTKLDFGVNAPVPVDINIDQRAFTNRNVTHTFNAALESLTQQIHNAPSVVRFTYHLTGDETTRQANQNIKRAERALRQHWNSIGQYPLRIDTRILNQ